MKINYQNLPRFLVPLFISFTIFLALISLFELSCAMALIIGLFIAVQLQKYEYI